MQHTITRIAVEEVKTTVTPLLTLPTKTIEASPTTTLQITDMSNSSLDTRGRIKALHLEDTSRSARAISRLMNGTPSHPTVQKYLDEIKAELAATQEIEQVNA